MANELRVSFAGPAGRWILKARQSDLRGIHACTNTLKSVTGECYRSKQLKERPSVGHSKHGRTHVRESQSSLIRHDAACPAVEC